MTELHRVCVYGFIHNVPWNEPHWHTSKCKEHNKYFCIGCIGQNGFAPKDIRKTGRPKHAPQSNSISNKETL